MEAFYLRHPERIGACKLGLIGSLLLTGFVHLSYMRQAMADYTPEKAKLFVDALRSGKRCSYAAQLVGVSRMTAYNWKKAHPDFASDWEEATSYANERMEQVVYDLGINGDIQAAMWWLRNHKPITYNKELLIKLLMAQLAIAQGGGEFELDDDGNPLSVPTNGNGKVTVNRRVTIHLPDNGRDDSYDPDKLTRLEEAVRAHQAPQDAPGAGAELGYVSTPENGQPRQEPPESQQEPVSEPVSPEPLEGEIEPPRATSDDDRAKVYAVAVKSHYDSRY